MTIEIGELDAPGLLFAYGTLKPASPRDVERGGWLADAVKGTLFDLGPYPALVALDDEAAGWVEGFVRPVTQAELIEVLDPYEAVDEGLFARRGCRTRAGRYVWVYTYERAIPDHARGPISEWSPPHTDFVPDLKGRPHSSRP